MKTTPLTKRKILDASLGMAMLMAAGFFVYSATYFDDALHKTAWILLVIIGTYQFDKFWKKYQINWKKRLAFIPFLVIGFLLGAAIAYMVYGPLTY